MPDYDATSRDVFSEPKNTDIINQIICHHFYRIGLSDVADELSKVCFTAYTFNLAK